MEEQAIYYFNRTLEHVQRVQKNGFFIITNHSEFLGLTLEDCREFAENLLKHDQTKFSNEQFMAYMEFTWSKKHNIPLTLEQTENFKKAWKDHYTRENHHPERLKGKALKMSRIEILETVCDLQAMAQEFGDGDCGNYFEETWRKRQSENFYDDFDWEQTLLFMSKVINIFKKSK